jgi:cellulose synthase/poly-beta-1,6-N-acetylglucosamine synthase-like glycosyltransferase
VSALRFVGGVFAVVLFLMTVRRYARRDVSRLNLIIIGVLSTSIVMLAIDPNLYNPLFSLFKFKEGNNQRLIGVLLLGEIVIVSLLIRNMSYTDAATLSIRHLVEALAVQSFDWDQVQRLPSGQRIVVVMPAFNEAENIGAVIHSMPDEIDGYPVVAVVVDDGSEDGTSEVARAAGALVARHPLRRGGGLALRVGYEIGLRLNAVVVVSMDSDGQHVADEMPLLVKPILEDEVDMVNGSRVLGEFERESLVRHLGVHFFSRLVTVLTGSRITDVSNGYRATRTDVLRKLNLDQDQFWASELLIEGMRHRLRIREVPITIRARAGGESKKPKTLRYAWNFTKAIVKTWLR